MTIDECHQILWDHFGYEFETLYDLDYDFPLDQEVFNQDGESVGTKRDYVIDAYDWMPEGQMDEHADKNSVDYACWVWYHSLFED